MFFARAGDLTVGSSSTNSVRRRPRSRRQLFIDDLKCHGPTLLVLRNGGPLTPRDARRRVAAKHAVQCLSSTGPNDSWLVSTKSYIVSRSCFIPPRTWPTCFPRSILRWRWALRWKQLTNTFHKRKSFSFPPPRKITPSGPSLRPKVRPIAS